MCRGLPSHILNVSFLGIAVQLYELDGQDA